MLWEIDNFYSGFKRKFLLLKIRKAIIGLKETAQDLKVPVIVLANRRRNPHKVDSAYYNIPIEELSFYEKG